MVRFTTDHKVYIKILYWGMGGSGKTTILDTLYLLTKEQKKDIKPSGDLNKIAMSGGSTLYFDRGIFQSLSDESIFIHAYTTAGKNRFAPLRKKISKGTDGIIFVFDSQESCWEDNVESLKELKKLMRFKLIKQIPLIIMLNKQDLPDLIQDSRVKQLLKDEGLMFEPESSLYVWNPVIYESIGLYKNHKNILEPFLECTQRVCLYWGITKSSLPEIKVPKIMVRINLTIPFELKREWDEFVTKHLKTSLSQMIRDAVREYQKSYFKLNEEPAKLELNSIETRIEKIVLEKMEKVLKNLGLIVNEGEK